MVSKHSRGIQSLLQTELRYFQTSQLFARREKLFFVLVSFQSNVNFYAVSNQKNIKILLTYEL